MGSAVTPATPTVRLRVEEDLGACVEALRSVHARDGYPTWWPTDPAAWLDPPGRAAAWVAVDKNGTVVGHVCVTGGVQDPVVTAVTGAPAGHLAGVSRLFTTPAVRGRALQTGARLLAQVQGWAQQKNLQLLLDVVDDGAPAVGLYDRLGWRLVDHRDADWTTPHGKRHRVRVYVAPESIGPAELDRADVGLL